MAYHYVMICPAYCKQWEEMQQTLRQTELTLKDLLSDKKCISALLKYIENMGHFKNATGETSNVTRLNTEA